MSLRHRWPLAAALAATMAASFACSDNSGPSLGDLHYTFAYLGKCNYLGCNTATSDSATRGDSIGFQLVLTDPTPDTTDLPQVRPACALNLEFRREGVIASVVTIPTTATCPDSTIPGGDNWPGAIYVNRVYIWRIPDSLPIGRYTVHSKVLVHPAVDRSATIEVH